MWVSSSGLILLASSARSLEVSNGGIGVDNWESGTSGSLTLALTATNCSCGTTITVGGSTGFNAWVTQVDGCVQEKHEPIVSFRFGSSHKTTLDPQESRPLKIRYRSTEDLKTPRTKSTNSSLLFFVEYSISLAPKLTLHPVVMAGSWYQELT
ncbi:hypothetical protein R3P38DRAFT_1640798 [Favolaschia claudopus]|uniref:Uncharacterized protein n=1 Tax=Favolaschia claudopus TaxID=2862362 RepID=A0AAW0DJ19_9AGAR